MHGTVSRPKSTIGSIMSRRMIKLRKRRRKIRRENRNWKNRSYSRMENRV